MGAACAGGSSRIRDVALECCMFHGSRMRNVQGGHESCMQVPGQLAPAALVSSKVLGKADYN
ncbi:hypothetical protein IG631_01523 [Alternaria alternata]|jgi:hypothetical protein|nr:hypothetical protein IG631_01523 [Alternaria alternata]